MDQTGGEILFIESSLSRGKGKLTLSGQLGDVMKESAMAALSYLRSNADKLNIDHRIFENYDLHIHVPAGAVPKDGPSAGVTILTSLASVYTQRKVRAKLAMTGEITLRGKVLPIGGVKEKVLAARRAGITEIILCNRNRKDIEEIDDQYLKNITIHYVNSVEEVLDIALLQEKVEHSLDFVIKEQPVPANVIATSMELKGLLTLLILTLLIQRTFGQTGGQHLFDFLNVAGDPKTMALGGKNVSSRFNDINAFVLNPATVNDSLSEHLSLNHTFYYGDINYSQLAFGANVLHSGFWMVGLQYFNYGKIHAYDELEQDLGELDAHDYAITIGHSMTAGDFTLGANMKLAVSDLVGYRASGLLFDLGGVYAYPNADLTIGISIRNFGFMLSQYADENENNTPFDIQLGASYKPAHMPFRFSITADHLTLGDLTYFDPDNPLDLVEEKPSGFDNVMRHFSFGGELILSRNVNLRIGYNYLIRKELRLQSKSGGAGLSYGLMFKLKDLEFAYTRSHYHVAGALNQIGITGDLNHYLAKKKL